MSSHAVSTLLVCPVRLLARSGVAWSQLLLAAACGLVAAKAAAPVEFAFELEETAGNPFAREISAEVITPSGGQRVLPAYFAGEGKFAVRARAEERGEYAIGKVLESRDGAMSPMAARILGAARVNVREPATLPAVTVLRRKPGGFVTASGESYVPLGANLAWAPAGGIAWYRDAFEQFSSAGLNWARVWMSHWGGLNLDWIAAEVGPSPEPGRLSETVARNWDALIEEAERRGVYLQVVLQHHGQWTTSVNPNWDINPWNAANPGGFLETPGAFFTSERAAQLTRQKYRYIVARWGYSPAVLAWELFNEVHWVDALRKERNEPAVARWHDAMAAHLRAVDVYRHLVTTSTEDLASPIYASMDYFQPHLYTSHMLAAVRRFDVAPEELDRPLFYGEMGNDHMRLTAAQKTSGVELVPIAWASAVGQGRIPAQIWEGEKLLSTGRVSELSALARFLRVTRLPLRDGLEAFSAAVSSEVRVPLVLESSEYWHKRPPLDLALSADGRESLQAGIVPRILVGSPRSVAEGYPSSMALKVEFPAAATVRVRVATAGFEGAKLRVKVDDVIAAEHVWAAIHRSASGPGEAPPSRPAEVEFRVAAGSRVIAIENVGGEDWFDLEAVHLGLETSALATYGRRGRDFVALWVWNRTGIFALEQTAAVSGDVLIEDVPAGSWQMTWWDSLRGEPGQSERIQHAGGRLSVRTPAISRHAALVLERRD